MIGVAMTILGLEIFANITFSYQVDPTYILIKQDMDQRDTDVLYEHTRVLKERRTLRLLGDREPDKEMLWVKRRVKRSSPSPHRRRSSPKRIGVSTLF